MTTGSEQRGRQRYLRCLAGYSTLNFEIKGIPTAPPCASRRRSS
jgi:hypothetical protein